MKDRCHRANKKSDVDKMSSMEASVERIRKARTHSYESSDAGMDRYFDWMVHCGKAYFLIGRVS